MVTSLTERQENQYQSFVTVTVTRQKRKRHCILTLDINLLRMVVLALSAS